MGKDKMIKLTDILREVLEEKKADRCLRIASWKNLKEGSEEEAWELVGQVDPNISRVVKGAGYKNDEESVAKLTPIIEKTPTTTINPPQIAKLKNFSNKPGEESLVRDAIEISKSKNPKQGYVDLMTKRDIADDNRQRGYDLGDLYDNVVSGNYEPPVLLNVEGTLYVIGGRTRLYAGLVANKSIDVKIVNVGQLSETSKETLQGKKWGKTK